MASQEELSHALQKLENKMCEKIGRRYTYFIEVAKSIIESLEDDLKEGIMDMRKQIILKRREKYDAHSISDTSFDLNSYPIKNNIVATTENIISQLNYNKQINDIVKTERTEYNEDAGYSLEQVRGNRNQANTYSTDNRHNEFINSWELVGNSYINNYTERIRQENIADVQKDNSIKAAIYSQNIVKNDQTKDDRLLVNKYPDDKQIERIKPNKTESKNFHGDINMDISQNSVTDLYNKNDGYIDLNMETNIDNQKIFSTVRDGQCDRRALTAAERQQICRYRKKLSSRGWDVDKIQEETEGFKRKLLTS